MALIQYYKGDRPDAYDEINDIIEDFLHNPKQTTDNFKELIHEDCADNNLCPICYSILSTKQIVANKTEAWGKLTNEYRYMKYCKNCGWTSENDTYFT